MKETMYYRPASVEDAVALLGKGVPLAGGTDLLRSEKKPDACIDLQDLGLDGIEVSDRIRIGAMVRLQQLVEAGDDVSPALAQACIDERGWNLRNMRTVGGSVAASDGRSPAMTVLLSMKPEVVLAPGDKKVPVVEVFADRKSTLKGKLILELVMAKPAASAYAQVARTPKDLPIVCAGVSRFPDGSWGVALGGFGDAPIRVPEAEKALAGNAGAEKVRAAVQQAYSDAEDGWASGEYRAETAAVLVARLAREVG